MDNGQWCIENAFNTFVCRGHESKRGGGATAPGTGNYRGLGYPRLGYLVSGQGHVRERNGWDGRLDEDGR